MRKRIALTFSIICIAMVCLCVRSGWHQIIRAEEYSNMAVEQQTRDVPIEAKRGTIYDRNGEDLAVSAACYSVWVRPGQIQSDGKSKEEKAANLELHISTLSEILVIDREKVKESVTKNQALVKVAKYLEKDTADKIREQKIPGVEISEDVKRYYPLGAFASHLLGSVTDDNSGLAGIELKYNQYLSGISGRWIKNTDSAGNDLSYGVEKYYSAEDGLNIILTIDEVIQHYVEKTIEKAMEASNSDRVMCIVMDPQSGDILAMAVAPDYNPNNPRVPLDEGEAAYVEELSDKEKLDYWNKMWRNPIVSDIYEPGSTSKLLTTAVAIEENLTSLSDTFVCNYSYQVAGVTLHCWRQGRPHGHQTLIEAVGNSCNPVFSTLAHRVGKDKFYEYMQLFGMTEKTGIDYPGEGGSIVYKPAQTGPVELTTMSYGQGIAVTMLQQITAISSLGNEGNLMQPRLVKALRDSDGNTIKEFKPTVVRKVISKKTAGEMCEIMKYVVSEGGGGNAKVPGYRVGGKTGTANKPAQGKYSSETYSSFIGMAPMDDPKVAILIVVDNPQGTKFGSVVAAPYAKEILEDTLRYLEIKPEYTEEEREQLKSKMVEVPQITGNSLSDAIGILGGLSLKYTVSPAATTNEDFIIVDQYPKAGERMSSGGTVYLYRE
ncbi:MAG: penicillin-binding transpeptidase domain-containing protein [Eubacteriales bacterium]|nr:penicillin-binding transpeptidase domain-containing protein [Eubacteriales bacterium]